ncbi:MAG TPA: TonB-dependent receptor [Polyangiales bacterium]|nr:TonB-dependent receptor [Polyangiales bacterium]
MRLISTVALFVLAHPFGVQAQDAAPPPAEPAPTEPAPEPAPDLSSPAAPAEAPAAPPVEAAPAQPPAQPEQAAEAPPEPAPAAQVPGTNELGEIVVTASRRRTTMQKYAGSAVALTQEELDKKGIKSVRDIGSASPSVEIGTQESNVEVYIRGVGTDYNTELGDPTVATHIDGVYIPRPRGVGSMLFDMERLEIAKGPQGTLRGRNAVGGTINLITAKPVLQEWLGDASLQLGNYSQRLGKGMVNIPIGEALALRLAAFGEVRDPFYENAGPVHTIIPSESADVIAYRASLLVQPLRNVKLTVQHDFTQEQGTGYSGSNYTPALTAGILPEEVPDPRAVIYRGPQPSQELQHWGISGNLHADFGPVLFEYIGSYRSLSYQQVSAGNAGVAFPGHDDYAVDDWGTSYWDTRSKSMVHELRAFAPNDARVRWTAGGFMFNENQKAFLGSTVDNTGGYAGNEFNMPSVKNHSYAGYLDAIVDILENWRGTAGARISTDAKSRDGIGYSYSFSGLPAGTRFGTDGFKWRGFGRSDYKSGGGDMFDDFLAGVERFGARDTIQTAINDPMVTLGQGGLVEQHGKYDATFVDFRVGTDVDLAPDHLLYVQFATGHKSGGFNDNVPVNGVSVAPTYDPEALYATEIGSKNKFADGNVIANLTGFWYHYVDQQFKAIQEIVPSGEEGKSGASSSVLFNAANSRILGLEAEVAARLPAKLRFDFSGTLLDARFTEGKVADTRLGWDASSQPMVDLEGNLLPRAPQLSINYGLSQVIDVPFGAFDWSVSAQTRSVQYMTVFNGDGTDSMGNVNPNLSDRVPSYTRVDINVGFTLPDKRVRLDAFVLNLTDVAYMTSLINTPTLNLRFFNPPRQIGARITVQL